jgi:hypothetical protein
MSEAETSAPSPEPAATVAVTTGEVTLTLSDIEAGLSALPRAKVARTISWVGTVAVVSLVAYRWMEGRDRMALVVMAVVLLGMLLVSGNPAKRIAKGVYSALPEAAKTIRVSVSEEGLLVASSGSEAKLPWTDVQRCVDARTVLVLFVSKHDAQIIPKRAFTSSDLDAIRKWSQTKVVQSNEPWLTPELRSRLMIWLLVFALVWTAFTMYRNR